MNKRILVIISTVLTLCIVLTPLTLAKPWENPNNNGKYQTFAVSLIGTAIQSAPEYEIIFKPNIVNPNVIVQTWGNNLVSNVIVIGGDKTYEMGIDFEYSQSCKLIIIANEPGTHHFVINYKYDFAAVEGGIDGTLEMLFMSNSNNGVPSIVSLKGTGELQNVHITATAPTMGTHEGLVSGWPQ